MRPLLGSAAVGPLHPTNLTLLAGLKPASPKLQKAVWQDLIREDDARQMDILIAKLDSMRAQKAPETKTAKPVRKDPSGKVNKLVSSTAQHMVGLLQGFHATLPYSCFFIILFCCIVVEGFAAA